MAPKKSRPRKNKKNADSEDKNSAEQNSQNSSAVANVNKNGEANSKRRKVVKYKPKVSCRRSRASNNETEDEQEELLSQNHSEQADQPDEDENMAASQSNAMTFENEDLHQEQFIEGDQVVRMAVRESSVDAEYLPSDDSENEIEFTSQESRRSNRSVSADRSNPNEAAGILYSDEDEVAMTDGLADEEGPVENPPALQANEVGPTHEQRIRDLDQEMLQKIQELQRLASQGGLTESAKLLNKINAEKETRMEGKNVNNNASRLNGNRIKLLPSKNSKDNVANDAKSSTKSVETIYEVAVPEKRISSSSEEDFNVVSSDDLGVEKQPISQLEKQLDALLSDERRRVVDRGQRRNGHDRETARRDDRDGDRHYNPRDKGPSTLDGRRRTYKETPEEKACCMIQEAENSKARIFATPGKNTGCTFNVDDEMLQSRGISGNGNMMGTPTAIVDEGYIVVGAHVDEATISKIKKGEYVDFGRLIPRDRVIAEEDGRMEMIVKDGRTFWSPVTSVTNIGSFAKWEQAFRVFSNIYCKANSHRSAELIEYNHIIHTIAMAYSWDNVYTYDKEFRMHMGRNPHRSWAMILQQAWSLRLKDRLTYGHSYGGGSSGSYNNYNYAGNKSSNGNGNGNRAKVPEPCRRFNRGMCNFGPNCKYEHKCNYCNKFGQGQ